MISESIILRLEGCDSPSRIAEALADALTPAECADAMKSSGGTKQGLIDHFRSKLNSNNSVNPPRRIGKDKAAQN